MMEVTFAGVGEAFDENVPNTSILVSVGLGKRRRQILLDCGFTAAHAFWRVSSEPLDLDAVWVSHFHGDHFMGLPLLFLRFWEEDRCKPLTIVGQSGVQDLTRAAMDLAFPNFLQRVEFPLSFLEVSAGKDLDLLGFGWSFAENGHSSPCLAVRLDHEEGSVFYSGDGRPTEQTESLAKQCDLVVHEAFGLSEAPPGHGSVESCIDFARKTNAGALALVHVSRDIRQTKCEKIRKQLAGLKDLKAYLPEPGDRLSVGHRFGS